MSDILTETSKHDAIVHRENVDEMFISWLIQNRDLNDGIIESYKETRNFIHEILKTCTMLFVGIGHQISHL